MSQIFEEEILSKQHPDIVSLESLNSQGERVSKRVTFYSIIDTVTLFVFIADGITFIVAGSKGECVKRVILYRKSATLAFGVMMAAVMFQSIYTIQVAEVWFFVFKRSDLAPHLIGLLYIGAFMYFLGRQRTMFYSIRESPEFPGLWLPVQADYTINDLLKIQEEPALLLPKDLIKHANG